MSDCYQPESGELGPPPEMDSTTLVHADVETNGLSGSCGHNASMIIDSRLRPGGHRWRRYKCQVCGERFSSVELRCDSIRPGRKNSIEWLKQELGVEVTREQLGAIKQLIATFRA